MSIPTSLSFVIATKNSSSLLFKTLLCFPVASSFVYEIVIQDGCSSDEIDSVVDRFSQFLPIKFESCPDVGIYDAWNKALRRISGDWVVFVGAGDTLIWDNLEQCIEALKGLSKAYEYYATPVHLISQTGQILDNLNPAVRPWQSLAQGMSVPHPGLFHKRSLFEDNKFSTKYSIAGDYEFLCRTLREHNVLIGDCVFSNMLVGGVSGDLKSMVRSEKELLRCSRFYFPYDFPVKPFLRLIRTSFCLAVSHFFGQKAGLIIADMPRLLHGRKRLWTAPLHNVNMPRLSRSPQVDLLVATVGRKRELRRLLRSIRQQSYKNIKIFIGDQNSNGYLEDLLDDFPDLRIEHIRLPKKGVSVARNSLLDKSTADIVAFPDDDCWYTEDTLSSVVKYFQSTPSCGALLGVWTPTLDHALPSVEDGVMSRRGLFYHAGTCIQFYRRESLAEIQFDPELGPGSGLPFGCGEDTDILLSVYQHSEIHRNSAIRVLHPSPFDASYSNRKVKLYAAGRMHLLRKHKFSLLFKISNVFYPLLRLPFESIRRGALGCKYRWAMFSGRLSGLLGRYPLE